MEAIAFKEWKIVCDALASGRQSLIFRKGGIHEGHQGFSFAHESFFLFSTHFHAQAEQVREGQVCLMPEWKIGDSVHITHHARALRAVTLTDWNQVSALFPFHIYSENTIRERFDWESKGMSAGSIHVALVEVIKLPQVWEFTYQKQHGGCRSWVKIPQPPHHLLEQSVPVVERSVLDHLAAKLTL